MTKFESPDEEVTLEDALKLLKSIGVDVEKTEIEFQPTRDRRKIKRLYISKKLTVSQIQRIKARYPELKEV